MPLLYNYEGESNENLKKCDKNSKHISIVCDNSDTHGLSGRQLTVRCRNATRRRSSSVKMAAPLATFTKEEKRLSSVF